MAHVDRIVYAVSPVDPAGDARNPYPAWAEMRGKPVNITRPTLDLPPLAHLYRYEDCLRTQKEPELFSSSIQAKMMPRAEHMLTSVDDPVHRLYRGLVAPPFTPRMVERWSTSLVHRVIGELLDQFAEQGKADLVADISFAYPAMVISEIVGLPQEDFKQFHKWADEINGFYADPVAGAKSGDELCEYVRPWVERKKAPTPGSILNDLLNAEFEGERLSAEQINAFLLLMIPAGIDTTYRSLGNLVTHLLDRPEVLDRVRKDRSLVPKAVEESLRFESPANISVRITTAEAEFDGVKIPEGTVLVPVLGSANRDPNFIDHPDVFDIDRPDIRHITFGMGVHQCLGIHLARMELRIGLNALLDRLPNLRWDEDTRAKVDAHTHGKAFRSPTAVPMQWDIC